MENSINWSDWIVAASAFITAVATGVLAYITRRYVRLTQEMLENSYKPEVVVRLLRTGKKYIHKEGTLPLLTVSVKNEGPGIARNVKFEGHDSFDPYKRGVPLLGSVYFIKDGFDRLLSGEERKSDPNLLGFPPRDLNKKVTITGTWEDSKGKKYCENFDLNFADPNLPQQ